jgi:hypothetical protein
MRLVASITQAFPAVVTTTFAHGYIAGTIVRLNIPPYIGMWQANQAVVTITEVLGQTSFAIDLDTSTYEPFAIPDPIPPLEDSTAQVVPVGGINGNLRAATQNVLPY